MYMKMLLALLPLVLLLTCGQRKTDSEEDRYVVVPPYNEWYLKDPEKHISYDYYVGHNIIIPENAGCFFYHYERLTCGTGWTVESPPLPIDFKREPLLKFQSLEAFQCFLLDSTATPRLAMFVSDADTIRNKFYFDISDMLSKLGGTYVIANRKTTPDEQAALDKSWWIDAK
jgi:hypothetical protein